MASNTNEEMRSIYEFVSALHAKHELYTKQCSRADRNLVNIMSKTVWEKEKRYEKK